MDLGGTGGGESRRQNPSLGRAFARILSESDSRCAAPSLQDDRRWD